MRDADRCKNCGFREWQIGLSTPRGHLFLCTPCADQFMKWRELHVQPEAYYKLLSRVFGGLPHATVSNTH